MFPAEAGMVTPERVEIQDRRLTAITWIKACKSVILADFKKWNNWSLIFMYYL
jgi:hypothetical protein